MDDRPESNGSDKSDSDCFELQDFPDVFRAGFEFGVGSFGTVKLCASRINEKIYAVKSIFTKDGGLREAEMCEILCVGKGHENVVKYFRMFHVDPRCFLVFEYMWGGDLRQLISTTSLSLARVRRFMKQILQGLKYCHDRDIVHRDIKPGNILLGPTRNGHTRVKIADFGLAIQLIRTIDWYGFAGSPIIVAPEMIKYQDYGKPIDVWACGVVFYTLLANGRHPFKNPKSPKVPRVTLYKRAVHEDPYPIDYPESENFASANRLLRTMLDKDQKTRKKVSDALNHPFIKEDTSSHGRELSVDESRTSNEALFVEDETICRALIAEFDANFDLEKEARKQLDPQRVIVLGSPIELQDSTKEVERKECIVNATKLMLRSVVENDDVMYYQFRPRKNLNCSLFGKRKSWGLDLEFGMVHHDKVIYQHGVIFCQISMVNPSVQLLSKYAACIAYGKIIRHATQEGRIVIQRHQETRLWRLVKETGRWQAIYLNISNLDRLVVGLDKYVL